LWATYVLSQQDYDVDAYLPYLITFAEEHERYLPEAFLYLLGFTEYVTPLLQKQINGEYWSVSGNPYYDTAVALWPLYYGDFPAKDGAINWLLRTQGPDGCWRGKIVDTAFILYAVWPEKGPSGIGGEESGTGSTHADCENSGYYCLHEEDCEGEILEEYSCRVGTVCCSVPLEKTCADYGGEICKRDEFCKDGNEEARAADLDYGEICCVGGSCEKIGGVGSSDESADSSPQGEEKTECEQKGYSCRQSCFSYETEVDYSCDYGEVCCSYSTGGTSSRSKLLIWILVALIILAVLGIVFRDGLRKLLLRFKFGKGGTSSAQRFGRGPPSRPQPPLRRFYPLNRYSPPQGRRGASRELDDVLKKLKEMGK